MPVGSLLLGTFALRTGWDSAYGHLLVFWDATQRCAV